MSNDSPVTTGVPAEPGSRRVAANFLVIGSAEAIGRVLAFVATLIAARRVGAAGYGVVAFAAGITLYLAKVADFGIEAVGTDTVAKRGVGTLASAILGLRLAIALGLVLVTGLLVYVVAPTPEREVFFACLLTLIPIAASTKWVHLGLEAARPIGLWRLVGEVTALVAVIVLVQDATDLWQIPASVFLGDGLAAAGLWFLLVRNGHALWPRWNLTVARPVFRRALPVMAQFIAGLLIYNMDLVFLRFMRTTEAVGFYAAAYTLIGFLANICTLYGLTLLPTLARLQRHSDEERRLYHTALAQAFAVTLPVMAGGWFVADTLVYLAFGIEFIPSGAILQILLLSVVPYAIRIVSWSAVVAHGHDMLALRAILYGVGINAILNWVLIDRYGTYGAASATVVTELVVCALTLFYASQRGIPLVHLARLWRPVVAGSAMAGALWLSIGQPLAILLAVGALVYAGVLWSLGGIRFRRWMPALAV